ncbi:hypothetical protein GHT06_020530 [Daphnia sinensis]|uniref:Uncharacterized protein n=1 Tax=Daphnia sinensis TaxID=1820382 RepID=A0AAD5PQ27_9CRUS|nr:hypothetical protein GHT06_020530 [Daphnia sinensis]
MSTQQTLTHEQQIRKFKYLNSIQRYGVFLGQIHFGERPCPPNRQRETTSKALPLGVTIDQKLSRFETGYYSVAIRYLPREEAVAATNIQVNRDYKKHLEFLKQELLGQQQLHHDQLLQPGKAQSTHSLPHHVETHSRHVKLEQKIIPEQIKRSAQPIQPEYTYSPAYQCQAPKPRQPQQFHQSKLPVRKITISYKSLQIKIYDNGIDLWIKIMTTNDVGGEIMIEEKEGKWILVTEGKEF